MSIQERSVCYEAHHPAGNHHHFSPWGRPELDWNMCATGRLLSVGTVLANPLPPGTTVVTIDDRLLTGNGRWNPTTRTVDNWTPPPVITDADKLLRLLLKGR